MTDVVAIAVSGVVGLGGLLVGWYQLRIAVQARTSEFRIKLYEQQINAYEEITTTVNQYIETYAVGVDEKNINLQHKIPIQVKEELTKQYTEFVKLYFACSVILPDEVYIRLGHMERVMVMVISISELGTLAGAEEYQEIFEKDDGSGALVAAFHALSGTMRRFVGTDELTQDTNRLLNRGLGNA